MSSNHRIEREQNGESVQGKMPLFGAGRGVGL